MAGVLLDLSRQDAEALFDWLGDRPYTEPWSARIYVLLADALKIRIPDHLRAQGTRL